MMKIIFTDCWEYDKNIPKSHRWVAELKDFRISVTASTKKQAFEEVITSLRVLIAYHSGITKTK